MNEEQDIDESNEQSIGNSKLPIENKDKATEIQPEIINPKPKTDNMEVHHHPHVGKKNFKEYILEGLMIFLAVTMGFIAENIREHIIENARAKELAESLYQEVYADSVAIQKIITIRNRKEKELTYFINYIKDSSLTNVSDRFYRSFTWSMLVVSATLFEPADGMLSQLRNSGSLRYFKSNKLQTEIGKFSVSIAKLRTRMEVENRYQLEHLRPFVMKFFDFKWYNELTKQGTLSLSDALDQEPEPAVPGKFVNASGLKRQEAENLASFYLLILRSSRITQLKNYAEGNHRLLETLREEYDLK